MKSKGGSIDISLKEFALEKYIIIAPTLSIVIEEFKDYDWIKSR